MEELDQTMEALKQRIEAEIDAENGPAAARKRLEDRLYETRRIKALQEAESREAEGGPDAASVKIAKREASIATATLLEMNVTVFLAVSQALDLLQTRVNTMEERLKKWEQPPTEEQLHRVPETG